jgi:hypothetical protein
MGPIAIPHYHDNCGSSASSVPLDIENPDEWQSTFDGYIIYDLVNEDYAIHSHQNLHKFDSKDQMGGYVPFDLGTSKLRMVLGLIKMASKCYGKNDNAFFETIIGTLSKEVKK